MKDGTSSSKMVRRHERLYAQRRRTLLQPRYDQMVQELEEQLAVRDQVSTRVRAWWSYVDGDDGTELGSTPSNTNYSGWTAVCGSSGENCSEPSGLTSPRTTRCLTRTVLWKTRCLRKSCDMPCQGCCSVDATMTEGAKVDGGVAERVLNDGREPKSSVKWPAPSRRFQADQASVERLRSPEAAHERTQKVAAESSCSRRLTREFAGSSTSNGDLSAAHSSNSRKVGGDDERCSQTDSAGDGGRTRRRTSSS